MTIQNLLFRSLWISLLLVSGFDLPLIAFFKRIATVFDMDILVKKEHRGEKEKRKQFGESSTPSKQICIDILFTSKGPVTQKELVNKAVTDVIVQCELPPL